MALGTNSVYAGVTDVCVFPWEHIALTDATTLEKCLYWSTLSQRIFPFYRYPGVYKAMVVIDGFFSAIWTTPPNCDEVNMIRVTPFPLPKADVKPEKLYGITDIAYSRREEQMMSQLVDVYKACQRAHSILVRKGLQEKKSARCDDGHNSELNEEKKESGFGAREVSMQHIFHTFSEELNTFKRDDPRKTW